MNTNSSDRQRKLRKSVRWLIILRGSAILVLAFGAIFLGFKHVWIGVGLFAFATLLNVSLLYRSLHRAKVLDQSYAARR